MEYHLLVSTFFNQITHSLASEWRIAAKQCISDDTERPHIHRFAMASLFHDFGSGIAERSRHRGEDLLWRFKHFGDAKVGEYERRIWSACEIEEVLWF